MNKDYPEVAGIPADKLQALILEAQADNIKHARSIMANNMLIAMAEHRLIGLEIQEAEQE
jgi:hypothetical protein